jgi:hypothetical protein
MNDYLNIILSSILIGSIYLFYNTFKILSRRLNNKFDGLDAFNITIMIFSGLIVLNTSIKALKILNYPK